MGQAGGKPEPIGILGFIGGQGHIWFVTNLAKRHLANIRSVAEAQKFGLEGDILRNAALFSSVDDRYAGPSCRC